MKIKKFFKPKVALVLGGGGARGLAHLGVISLLEREGIAFDLIVGTSIGALVGSLYAIQKDSKEAFLKLFSFFTSKDSGIEYFDKLKEISKPKKNEGFFKKVKRYFLTGSITLKTLTKESYIPREKVTQTIDTLFKDIMIEDIKPQVAIVATDLSSGSEVVLTKGKVSQAVKASIAIAGIFPYVKLQNKILIDGGYVNQIPVETAFKLGADVVIAVNVSTGLPPLEERDNVKGNDAQLRSVFILSETAKKYQLRFADVVVTPNFGDLQWTDFDKIERFYEEGFKACEEKLPEIKRAIFKAYFKKVFWQLFGRKWKIDLRNG